MFIIVEPPCHPDISILSCSFHLFFDAVKINFFSYKVTNVLYGGGDRWIGCLILSGPRA